MWNDWILEPCILIQSWTTIFELLSECDFRDLKKSFKLIDFLASCSCSQDPYFTAGFRSQWCNHARNTPQVVSHEEEAELHHVVQHRNYLFPQAEANAPHRYVGKLLLMSLLMETSITL